MVMMMMVMDLIVMILTDDGDNEDVNVEKCDDNYLTMYDAAKEQKVFILAVTLCIA